MAEFSYQADIAPLRSQFFPVTSVRAQDLEALNTSYLRNIVPLQDRAMKLQGQALDDLRKASMMDNYETRRKIQEQQLEALQFKFQQDKENAIAEGEVADSLRGLEETLSQYDSPTEKQNALMSFTANNPNVLKTPMGRSVVSMYGQQISGDRSVEINRTNRMGEVLMRGGMVEEAEKLFSGEMTPTDVAPLYDQAVENQKRAEAAEKQKKNISEQLKDMRDFRENLSIFTNKTAKNIGADGKGQLTEESLSSLLGTANPDEVRLRTTAYEKLIDDLIRGTGKEREALDELYEDDHLRLFRDHGQFIREYETELNPLPTTKQREIRRVFDR